MLSFEQPADLVTLKMKNKLKPMLEKNINLEEFKNYYWLKTELIDYCKRVKLSTLGRKEDLQKRIEAYLATGKKIETFKDDRSKSRDSHKELTLDTPVIHYKNDNATRNFFVEHIGSHFRFNDYLRKFRISSPEENSRLKLTYGDLVKGWLVAEENKKKLGKEYKIGNQFEYNQFIRDFFIHEKGKTHQDAVAAWNLIKSQPGPRTYAHYVDYTLI